MESTLTFGVILVAGFLLAEAMMALGFPKVTGYILAGIVLNPRLNSLIPMEVLSQSSVITNISLAFITFSVGGSLFWPQLKKLGKTIASITFFEAEFAALAVLAAQIWLGQLVPVDVGASPTYRVAAGGAVVLAVGGTALYIKALSEGLFEGPGADPAIRARLRARARKEGLAALHAELGRVDPHAAGRIHPNDEKRIIRALEVFELTGRPISRLQRQWDARRRRYECVFIGLRRSRQDTNRRINARVKRMIEMGLREEVATLLAEPKGLSPQAAQALGYAEMIRHLRGQCSLEEAVEQIKINTRQFAKQQRTWFRRFADVHWIDVAEDDSVEKTADAAMRFVQGS